MDSNTEHLTTYDKHLVEELIFSANWVIDNWESGDLASAVNTLRLALEAMDARFLQEDEKDETNPK